MSHVRGLVGGIAALVVAGAACGGPMFWPFRAAGSGEGMQSREENAAYLRALGSRFSQGLAEQCYPEDLPQEDLEEQMRENALLPASIFELDPLGRFFFDSIVWTGNGQQGSSAQAAPAQLTYSFPAQATPWGIASRPVVPNDLGSGLGHVFGGANHDLGLEYLRQALAGWRKISGLTYTEVADNNTPQDVDVFRTSARGDLRIGAGFAWPDSYLAYNFFPGGGGDMFFNSRYWEGNFFASAANSYRYLRNTTAHENGHGLGFFHVVPCNNLFLMEPFLSTAFDIQQIDDIRNANRNYGDRFAGNNSAANARDFGNLTSPSPRSIIERTLSTNGTTGPNNTDEDWFRFTTSSTQNIVISVTPIGGSYINGPQSGACNGTTSTVDAARAGNLNVELRSSDGTTVILTAASAAAGSTETLTANARPAGTYTVRVFDVGSNSSANQIVQLYDLSIRVGSAFAPPYAIAGINKRVMVNQPCFFLGDINSTANEPGATLTTYDWDLDGNGTFESVNNPRPIQTYLTTGPRQVTLRVTDSNGFTDTDTISVQVYAAEFTLTSVSPYPFRNTFGTTVPITIYGTNLSSITSLNQLSIDGGGLTLVGTPVVNSAGNRITGVSVQVASNATKGIRTITASNGSTTSRAVFFLYPRDPGSFNITSPSSGAVASSWAPIITWSPSSDAATYLVQIATDSGFTNVIASSSSAYPSFATSWQAPFSTLVPGNTYFARVRALNETNVATFTPTISFIAGNATVNNNNCAGAITVTNGVTPFNTVPATTDGPDEPSCNSGGVSLIDNDVWYRYVATCTGPLEISLCGSPFDTFLAVYGGSCPVGPGAVIACDDEFCPNASRVLINAVRNNVYYIRVGGWFGARGSGVMSITCTHGCNGDADQSGAVNFNDITIVLATLGATGLPYRSGDSDGNGVVNFNDITVTLASLGVICP